MAITVKGQVTAVNVPGLAKVVSAAAPTVTPTGTAGTTTNKYQIVGVDAFGDSLPSATGTSTTSNATLSGTNYDAVSWTAIPGATAVRVLFQPGGTGPFLLLATLAGNATSYNNTGAATSTYATAPATVGNFNIQITPNAGTGGSANQGGYVNVELNTALLSGVANGSCTLTFSQP